MRVIVALACAAVLIVPAPAAAVDTTPPDIAVAVDGTQGDGVWFRGKVSVTWTITEPEGGIKQIVGCEPSVIADDTPGTTRLCRVESEGGITEKSVVIRLDATPPAATAATPSREPDNEGWYSRAFDVTWAGGDATSGIASCTASSYGGPDTGGGSLSGTCRDRAGNVSASLPFGFRFDATPPTVTSAAATRAATDTGWLTAPVDLVWQGSDATSGIAECTALRYAGPDGDPALPTGTCRDRAGNVSAAAPLPIRYDATPPRLTAVTARRTARGVQVGWVAEGATGVRLLRGATVLYRGAARRFTDRTAKPGRTYSYAVEATDAAGNTARTTVTAAASRGALLSPADGARLRGGPLLRWRAVRGARFYNVQLFRAGRKVLTRWPARARLRLGDLPPGRYAWYVWAAYGSRSAPRYGALLGRRTFVIR